MSVTWHSLAELGGLLLDGRFYLSEEQVEGGRLHPQHLSKMGRVHLGCVGVHVVLTLYVCQKWSNPRPLLLQDWCPCPFSSRFQGRISDLFKTCQSVQGFLHGGVALEPHVTHFNFLQFSSFYPVFYLLFSFHKMAGSLKCVIADKSKQVLKSQASVL